MDTLGFGENDHQDLVKARILAQSTSYKQGSKSGRLNDENKGPKYASYLSLFVTQPSNATDSRTHCKYLQKCPKLCAVSPNYSDGLN